jgi:hypothetical protein
MKTILIGAVVMILAARAGRDELTGKWESKPSEKGNVTGVIFKADNSFEGFVNKKPFTSGVYEYHDGIFSFVDNGCSGIRGTYKVIFFSHADSLRLEPLNDSCEERKKGMSRLILGRKK